MSGDDMIQALIRRDEQRASKLVRQQQLHEDRIFMVKFVLTALGIFALVMMALLAKAVLF